MTQPYAICCETPGRSDQLQKIEIEIPTPDQGEVQIRQTAIGLNFIDIYFRTGLYPWPQETGLILGCEGAGVVEAVGIGVETLKVGDRVAYAGRNGGYATHRRLAAKSCVKIPEGISDEQAAAVMLKGLTAVYLISNSYPVQRGDTVLVHAASGGVGLMMGQMLKDKGVRAIGTAGGPEKCALALENGYADVIDYSREDFVTAVQGLTNGEGVAAAYDSIGKDTILKSAACLKTFGTLVSFGQSSGAPDNFRIADLARACNSVCRPALFFYYDNRDWLNDASRYMFDLIETGKLTVHIRQRRPLEDVAKAHDDLEGRKTMGATILQP